MYIIEGELYILVSGPAKFLFLSFLNVQGARCVAPRAPFNPQVSTKVSLPKRLQSCALAFRWNMPQQYEYGMVRVNTPYKKKQNVWWMNIPNMDHSGHVRDVSSTIPSYGLFFTHSYLVRNQNKTMPRPRAELVDRYRKSFQVSKFDYFISHCWQDERFATALGRNRGYLQLA